MPWQHSRPTRPLRLLGAIALLLSCGLASASGQEVRGTIRSLDIANNRLVLTSDTTHKDLLIHFNSNTKVEDGDGHAIELAKLTKGTHAVVTDSINAARIAVAPPEKDGISAPQTSGPPQGSFFQEFLYNFRHNLFKPLLLFFYLGFLVPIFRVKFEFPYVIYQGLTIYLLIAIGWHGGEELAGLNPNVLGSVFGFMLTGFVTNFFIGIIAFFLLKAMSRLRRIDRATVAGYYGSDSAGTFVTCLGVLLTAKIAYDAYMPVMLAVMEIPGCLVALYLVGRLRHEGMDANGNMPDEPGYNPNAVPAKPEDSVERIRHGAEESEKEISLEKMEHPNGANGNGNGRTAKTSSGALLSPKLLHEVFLNPGLYLLFGGIIVGFISGLQGPEVTRADDSFFVNLFQGILCLFLLEMGMTASRKLRDLKTAGIGYVICGLLMPNIFALIGICVAAAYSTLTHTPFQLGTYVLFSVLCAAASYIAVPAVQRLAIPEASPTLPLAASLGLTFSYNVTIGIPIYIELAKAITGLR